MGNDSHCCVKIFYFGCHNLILQTIFLGVRKLENPFNCFPIQIDHKTVSLFCLITCMVTTDRLLVCMNMHADD